MTLLIIASSNAVNLTDGVDGLATGALTMVLGAYTLISIWQRNQWCRPGSTASPMCYEVRDPWDLAVVSAALAAACFGFLWWNAKPAKIFMGDTGSLALGGAVGGLAILTRTELLLIILGFLFVIEAASVMIQVSYFKITRGKRVFRWPRCTTTSNCWAGTSDRGDRFWIICGTASVACRSSTPSARAMSDERLDWLPADRLSPWPQANVVVAGLGTSGFAAADALLELGATVTVLDDSADDTSDKATLLEHLDAHVRIGWVDHYTAGRCRPGHHLARLASRLRPARPGAARRVPSGAMSNLPGG